jgi:phage gpG-like protein
VIGNAAINEIAQNKVTAVRQGLQAERDEFLRAEDPLAGADDVIAQADPGSELSKNDQAELDAVLKRINKMKAMERQMGSQKGFTQRTSAIVRSAMAQNKGLADQIQRAASQVLGFNPIGQEIQDKLAADRAIADAAAAELQRYDDIAAELNLPIADKWRNPQLYYGTIIKTMRQMQRTAEMETTAKELQARGALTDEVWTGVIEDIMPGLLTAQQLELERLIAPFYTQDRKELAEGITSGDMRVLSQELQALKFQLINEHLVQFEGISADGTGVTAEVAAGTFKPVFDMIDLYAKAVEEGRSVSHLKNFRDVKRAQLFANNPRLAGLELSAELVSNLQGSKIAGAASEKATSEIAKIIMKLFGEDSSNEKIVPDPDAPGVTNVHLLNPYDLLAKGIMRGIDELPSQNSRDLARQTTLRGIEQLTVIANNMDRPEDQRKEAHEAVQVAIIGLAGEFINASNSGSPLMNDIADTYVQVSGKTDSIIEFKAMSQRPGFEQLTEAFAKAENMLIRRFDGQLKESLVSALDDGDPFLGTEEQIVGFSNWGQWQAAIQAAESIAVKSTAEPVFARARQVLGPVVRDDLSGIEWILDEKKAKAIGLNAAQIESAQDFRDDLNGFTGNQTILDPALQSARTAASGVGVPITNNVVGLWSLVKARTHRDLNMLIGWEEGQPVARSHYERSLNQLMAKFSRLNWEIMQDLQFAQDNLGRR